MKKILSGLGVSAGQIRGRVRLLENNAKISFNTGDILVTRVTDPSMTPLMVKAGGIVCDTGGMMSHPSIVSRELGIPCVVGTKNATTMLKDNQLVEINGASGEVFLVEE